MAFCNNNNKKLALERDIMWRCFKLTDIQFLSLQEQNFFAQWNS